MVERRNRGPSARAELAEPARNAAAASTIRRFLFDVNTRLVGNRFRAIHGLNIPLPIKVKICAMRATSPRAAARLNGISDRTLRRWIAEGLVPGHACGRRGVERAIPVNHRAPAVRPRPRHDHCLESFAG
jgi:hypothetical protein